ncbi:MAG: YbaK/EbsC family protein [Candidatus Uhrbacteria bacterium]
MPISKKLLNALSKQKVKYRVISHRKVFTAYDLAATLRGDLKNIAKTLLVRADRRYVLVVLPANQRLDFGKLAKLLKAKAVSIASETSIAKLKFKPGTTPPFGSLVGLPVFVERALARAGDIIVRAGSFTESIGLKAKDFIRMESPILGAFGAKSDIKLPVAPRKIRKPVVKSKRSKRRARK